MFNWYLSERIYTFFAEYDPVHSKFPAERTLIFFDALGCLTEAVFQNVIVQERRRDTKGTGNIKWWSIL